MSTMNTLTSDRYRLADKVAWRVGYGAMQLAGDGVFGPPHDRAEAIAVLRAAVDAGVDHIDTAQYYGPGVVNELIREALFSPRATAPPQPRWRSPGYCASLTTSC
jgi:predicted aldo/keto reductase-like oxidoreductase